MAPARTRPGSIESLLQRHWYRPQPSALARLLRPLSWLYGGLLALQRRLGPAAQAAPVPLVVVGNLVAGGTGKTPIVIALVQALREAGHTPGVISRGHGRRGAECRAVTAGADPAEVGDEPLLIHRRTDAPVWVARARLEAARALCRAHPAVDVLIADDGLQHLPLRPQAAWIVFDDRGAGNGLLLPAGPLRSPMPRTLAPHVRVVYTGSEASTPLPGTPVVRRAGLAVPLPDWVQRRARTGRPLTELRGRRMVALAGIGSPARFFALLDAQGLDIEPLPQRDHADYRDRPPWPPGTAEVITTEKDAVKLARLPLGGTWVWVVPLDCVLPAGLVQDLLPLLAKSAKHDDRPSTP